MPKVYIYNMGGQYTHVIWRTMRDLDFDAEIIKRDVPLSSISDAYAIIISGGPGSAPNDSYPVLEEIIKKAESGEFAKPLLGICFGHQLIAHVLGGKVEKGTKAEYGAMKIKVDDHSDLFAGVPDEFNAWVSHFDEVKSLPKGFVPLAHSEVCKFEAMRAAGKKIFGVQFHPEVWHTEHGETILKNFLSQGSD